jgi:Chitobiase/beta-hexosaminidase C-terminal domain/Bacterial Ig-like domain
MKNFLIRRLLPIGLLVLVSMTGIAWIAPVFAENRCDNNDDNNCNQPEKNQKLSPKVKCKVHTDVADHNKNTVVGPIDLQCNSKNSNIRDSTVIQNPSDGDFDPLIVVSTDPSDGDNNVPTDLSEIKVTFDENIDKDSVDSGSLSLFTNNGFGTTPDVNSVSVSSKTATFKISQSSTSDRFTPGVTYIASISSSVRDEDGNFLDCFDSTGVDDSCEWDFSISGTTTSPVVTASPQGGTYNTSQSVTLTSSQPDTDIFYTTDGSSPSTASTLYTGPIPITTTTILKFFGENAAGNIGPIVTEIYTIDNQSTVNVHTSYGHVNGEANPFARSPNYQR